MTGHMGNSDRDRFESMLTIMRNKGLISLWANASLELKDKVKSDECIYKVGIDNKPNRVYIFSNIDVRTNQYKKSGSVRLISEIDLRSKNKDGLTKVYRTKNFQRNLLRAIERLIG